MNLFHDTKGTYLMLSVVITGVILTGSLVASILIVRELRISRNVDDALLAYYGADSVIETGLYEIRKKGTVPETLTGSGTFSNGVAWTRTVVSKTKDLNVDFLEENSALTVDLFDSAALPTGVPANYASLRIQWKIGIRLRVVVKPWSGTAFATGVTTEYFCGGTSPCGDVVVALDPTKAHEVTITALDDDVSEIHVKAYTSPGAPLGTEVDFPIPIIIYGKGSLGKSHKALEVKMQQTTPW